MVGFQRFHRRRCKRVVHWGDQVEYQRPNNVSNNEELLLLAADEAKRLHKLLGKR